MFLGIAYTPLNRKTTSNAVLTTSHEITPSINVPDIQPEASNQGK